MAHNEPFVVGHDLFTSVDANGKSCNSFGVTFTSKDMIRNLEYEVEISSENGVALVNDSTYKLILGGWVLNIIGSLVVIFDDDGSSHLSFRLHMIQATMVESEESVTSLYLTHRKVARDFLGIVNLPVERIIQDASRAYLNAVIKVLRKRDGTVTDIINCSVQN